MREEQVLRKRLSAMARDHRHRDPAQFMQRSILRRERERHEPWPNLGELQAELPRDAISEIGRAELRERKPSRRDDERRAFEGALAGEEAETIRTLDGFHAAVD